MPRLTPLDLDHLTPEQQEVANAIVSGPRGGLRGPFDPWLRSPQLADRAQRLGEFCRFHSSLPPRLSEMAIIVTGAYWKSQYEFYAHARLAREAGLPDAVIEAIRTGVRPDVTGPEAAIYDFVTEFLNTKRVSDATYARAIEVFGERGVVDLVGIVGYYGLVSMTLNVFDVPLPAGVEPPLPA
ncbi:MAG: carboxymuconolactone decarboxylase [Chloroflexota bacterium]